MGIAPIEVSSRFYEDDYQRTFTWFIPTIIFGLITLIIICILHYSCRRKQHYNKNRCGDIIKKSHDAIVSVKQIEIRYNIYSFLSLKFHRGYITSVDIYATPTIQIDESLNENFSSLEERKLICYCDGSYSHYMRIGYSGFLASNGVYRVRFFSPQDPRRGSTDTEVLAAYLAIQYALEKHYNTLIIYTDNSKVEQLLKRPKEKDYINYSNICQVLNQYQQQNGNNAIQVIRVRGHTSISEQRKCKIKHEFAKIDRTPDNPLGNSEERQNNDPFSTKVEKLVLHEHIKTFVITSVNYQLKQNDKNLYAYTHVRTESNGILISCHSFNINDDNQRLLFLSQTILDELVHAFEPIYIDLERMKGVFCEVYFTEKLSSDPAEIIFEQADIR